MKTVVLKAILFLITLSLFACKSDEKKANDNNNSIEVIKDNSESNQYLENIKRAHNASKFAQEEQVKFKLKLNIGDDQFFDGYITLKTDGSKARFLDSKVDKIISIDNLSTELDKKLYWLVELYTMGFWLQADQFEMLKNESDEYSKSTYKSSITNNTYNIYSHPLTNVIQQVEYQSGITDEPFNSGTVYFDKYITVNRVPVSLVWEFKQDNSKKATAEISRISYPDVF
jgi:hypothetical protein